LLFFLFFNGCSDSEAILEASYLLNELVPKVSSASESVSSAACSWNFYSLGDDYDPLCTKGAEMLAARLDSLLKNA
jgi:hypothetical protein